MSCKNETSVTLAPVFDLDPGMKSRFFTISVCLAFSLFIAPLSAAACGGPEQRCEVASGSYFAMTPDANLNTDIKPPLLIFFHGGGGWGDRIFKQRAKMAQVFIERGYVLIAPNGTRRQGSRFGPGWAFGMEGNGRRDELRFTKELIADAEERFDTDPDRILITGYSVGGSNVAYLACREPGLATAYAPVAGGFWRPHPRACNGPVRYLHTHGWRDQTVPLEGRPLGPPEAQIQQGDIFEMMQEWRRQNECTKLRPDSFETNGPFWRRIWKECRNGTALEFALHPGGHRIPDAWAHYVLNWFESITTIKQN